MMSVRDIIINLRFLQEMAEREEKGVIEIDSEKAEFIFGEAIDALERAANDEKIANKKIMRLVDLLVKE